MKTNAYLLLAAITFILLGSCNKEYNYTGTTTDDPGDPLTSKYETLQEFHAANEVKSQSFQASSVSSNTFTASQGTKISIPSNAFVTLSGDPVAGDVLLQFKEIYKKSDMILSAKPTMQSNGMPLKSAGEFFAKATYNGQPVRLAPGKSISVEPATFGMPVDPDMEAFTAQLNPFAWDPATVGLVVVDSSLLTLYVNQFLEPEDSGTWYNCDNGSLFSSYPQTTLTLHQSDDPEPYGTGVYLVFDDMNAVIAINNIGGGDFQYNFAPVGLSCTAVAVGLKGNVLYGSFIPVSISANQTLSFTMSPVTEDFLIGQLKTLD